jgi:chromosome segregation ATPase
LQIEFNNACAISQSTEQLLNEIEQTVLARNATIEQLQGQMRQLQDEHAAELTRLK